MGRVLRSLVRQRPSSAWALSLLLLGAAARCLFGTGSHVAGSAAAMTVTAVGAGCALLAVLVYVAGSRCHRRLIFALLVLTTLATSLIVAGSDDRADVALSALAYPWTSLYAAHFLSRRAAYAHAALIAIGFGAGIAANGLPGLVGAWVIVTTTVVGVTAVTSSLIVSLRRQSETDPLTRIANRAGFRRLASQVLAAAERQGHPVALILCDIDGLKQINDVRGHAAGDEVLTGVVRGWRGALRGNDVLARLGGDEFAVLLPDTSPVGAQATVERLRAATSSSFSAGIASWTPGTSLDSLLADADAAMYACKLSRKVVGVSLPAQRRSMRAVLAES